ncbi:hypothetical protein ACGFZB_28750 [Streptomyces cinerochromogenes]|uniref:Uncharacterized protein n=1 Tax=Streptomyces cinerochromogenes TaxID=66422 RepID=A0ABW7BAW2_9ACTN
MTGALHVIDAGMAPALGDIRTASDGDVIYIRPDATERRDFPKYWEAAGAALSRGAKVVVMRREESA